MTATVSVRLDDKTLKELKKIEKTWHADRSEIVRRLLDEALQSWKLRQSLQRLATHDISVGMAAKETGKSVWDILDLARQNNIDWTGYSKQDIERDLKVLEGK
jgi:predicted transcriptional regulator